MISDKLLEKMQELEFTEEQIEFIKKEVIKDVFYTNGYKIKCGIPYEVRKQYYKEYVFYKIPVFGKNNDGESKIAYRTVQFIGCDPIKEDKDKIIIKNFFEDFYYKESDAYNPVWIIKIMDYEYVENEVKEQRETSKALEQYTEEVNYNLNDLPF